MILSQPGFYASEKNRIDFKRFIANKTTLTNELAYSKNILRRYIRIVIEHEKNIKGIFCICFQAKYIHDH